MVSVTCHICMEMQDPIHRCTNSYSQETVDKESYEPFWQTIYNTSRTAEIYTESLSSAFHYKSESTLNGSAYWGYLQWYEGGGYVANLGETPKDTQNILSDLEQTKWIDQFTRAVFVEFNVWNGNTNLFNLAKIVFEMPPHGGVFVWSTTESVQLYRYVGAKGLVSLLAEVSLVIFIFALIIREVIRLYRKGPQLYFQGFWTMMLLLSIMCFVISLGYYVSRTLLTIKTVENLRNNDG